MPLPHPDIRAARTPDVLPGQRFYRKHGYRGAQPRAYDLPGGLTIEFVPMVRELS